MANPTTQPTLLARLRDHADHAAWREFEERYRDLIQRYCRRRGLQQSDAEDVRQMVLLNLARQLKSFEYRPDRGRFRSYLGQVTRNAIHRYFRRPRLDPPGLETDVVADMAAGNVPGQGPGGGGSDEELDQVWEHEWMLHHYRIALASVRTSAEPRSVEVFEHLLAGETPDEVAARFEMSKDAVHKIKQRMRNRLKELVARQVQDEELG
jgi:RNA polymerase sigma-70 factor (ECF subfamily)